MALYGYKEVQLKTADLNYWIQVSKDHRLGATSYAMLRTTTADPDYVCIHMCK